MVLTGIDPMRGVGLQDPPPKRMAAAMAVRDEPARREAGADGSGAMFDRISARYDLLNRVLSLGLDRRWRRRLAAAASPRSGERVLDLATGTGDVVLELRRRCGGVEIVGLDPSRRMLELARTKLLAARVARCRWSEGVAEDLPFADASFDAATMAFGIRNVNDRERALREISRVLRPGGRLAILELTEPRSGPLAPLSRLWVRGVVPRLGGLLASRSAYRYLQRSMAAFPEPPAFARTLAGAGFEVVEVSALGFGACALFVARRPGGGGAQGR